MTTTTVISPNISVVTQKIDELKEQRDAIQCKIALWEMVLDAEESESSPLRDRMAVCLDKKRTEFTATYRWEINPHNGWLTVQLEDGSIMPFKLGDWCPYSFAADFFGILRSEITIDDPKK